MSELKLTNEVIEAINNLKLAKSLEDEAKLLKTHAQEILTAVMEQANITKYPLSEGGSITRIPTTIVKSFSKDKMKIELLHHGIDAIIIGRCFDASYEEKPRAGYIRYAPPKP